MKSDEFEQLNAEELRVRLGDAERKYYNNLHQLQGQLTRLNMVQALSSLLIRYKDQDSALNKLVELSVKDLGVEKALVLVPEADCFVIAALKGYSRRHVRELDGFSVALGYRLLAEIKESAVPVLYESFEGDLADTLDLTQSTICPLRSDTGDFFGFFIVGFSPGKIGLYRTFSENDLDFFQMLASQVSALLQNIKLSATFRKFVPRQFLDRIAKHGLGNIALGEADASVVTILFADIRSFTTLSETLSPEELLDFLNNYFNHMNSAIHANGGFIDKFIGDAIMCLFVDEDPAIGAQKAVQTSLDMQKALQRFNDQSERQESLPISIGIGIHTGEAVIGTVGSADRMDSTVLGDAVNLASRIESLTKQYEVPILISSSTYNYLEKDSTIHCREVDLVTVRGREERETIYEVLSGVSKKTVDRI